MKKRDMIEIAIRNLWKRKLRTLLTVLGVIIGTASIVVMVSIGIGMNVTFAKELESWGSLQVIQVYPNSNMSYDAEENRTGKAKKKLKLDNKTVEEFKRMEFIEVVSPVVEESMCLVSGKYVADASIMGIDPGAMEALGYKAEQGRLLTAEDNKAIVVGGAVEFYNPKLSWEMRYRTKPPEIDVLQEKISITYDMNYGTRDADKSIKPIKVQAVGTLSEEGGESWRVIMPMKEVQKLQKERQKWERKKAGEKVSTNKNEIQEYQQVLVKVSEVEKVQEVQNQIKDMGFRAISLKDELETMKDLTKMLNLVLGAIGAVSMIVAAINITNTMIMSIYERTKEIGIMKVIGASLKDIKGLFLTEAAFIGTFGGVAGIVLSYIISFIINLIIAQYGNSMRSVIPIWLALSSVAFATGVGVLSGYLPAQRAMKLSALTAIKTE